jgi:hypothetical protein
MNIDLVKSAYVPNGAVAASCIINKVFGKVFSSI